MGVTIKQIAQEVGLSWPAVSQILNQRGRFAADTRKRVLAAAAKHGYRPNSSARALRDQSSKLVGVLFRNDANNPLTNMSAFEYLLGINQRFQEADLGTLLIRAGELAQAGDVEPRVFRERLVDGVIVVGEMPTPLVERVSALSQRLIWLDGPTWKDTCCIRRDEHQAGYLCVDALANLGYKRVTFATRDASLLRHHSHHARQAGAKAAAKARRVDMRVIIWPENDPATEFTTLREELTPDAGVVAASLPTARRIMHGAAALDLSPGFDYGLVCCDDSFDTQTGWRGLSRTAFHRYALGEQAAGMMLSLLADPSTPPPSQVVKNPWYPGCTAWGPNGGAG